MKKQISKRKRRIIFTISVIGLPLLIAISFNIYTIIYNNATDSPNIVSEYHALFSNDAQNKLQIVSTEKSRNREPMSFYRFDKRFGIYVFKETLSNNTGLTKIVNYRNESSARPWFGIYNVLSENSFEMNISAAQSTSVSGVTFKSSGDSITTIVKSDSLYCYYYKFKTFSIRYNDNPYDITGKSNRSDIPASILFKKKGSILYIILMTVVDGEEKMAPNLLYEIIDK